MDNLGFDLYRVNPDGTSSVKLNSSLIPGLLSSAIGKEYTYVDTGINTGTPVCYLLSDIDLHEQSTTHGPVCISQPAPQGQSSTQGTTQGQDSTGGSSLGTGAGSSSTTGSQVNPVSLGTLPQSTGPVTAIKLASLTALKGPEGILIEWKTGYEVENLGCNVYRDEGGKRTDSALALANTTFPFFINLTCLNGYFIIPTVDSLATTLLTDTAGGAVGVIASSSLTGFTPQTELGSALLGELFTGATVGEALVAAKRVVSDPDVRRSYLLFGDPSMRVRR